MKITTNDITEGHFTRHGEVSYSVKGRVISTIAVGPFNVELITSLADTFGQIYEQLDPEYRGNWIEFLIVRGCALGTADAIRAHQEYLNFRKEEYSSPIAVVGYLDNVPESVSLATEAWRAGYDSANSPLRLTDNLKEALEWLNEY